VRTNLINKTELYNRLIDIFGYNTPIFISEIKKIWKEYSKSRIFQLLKEFKKENKIINADTGVYYLPTKTIFGNSTLGRYDIILKKFIENNNEIYGYFGGLKLLNQLKVSRQVPSKLEVVTSKSLSPTRISKVYSNEIKVRKSRVQITKNNVSIIILLEVFRASGRSLSISEASGLRLFSKTNNIKKEDVFEYSKYFSPKVIANLLATGIDNVFA
jgi:hypothetical protein